MLGDRSVLIDLYALYEFVEWERTLGGGTIFYIISFFPRTTTSPDLRADCLLHLQDVIHSSHSAKLIIRSLAWAAAKSFFASVVCQSAPVNFPRMKDSKSVRSFVQDFREEARPMHYLVS